MPNDQREVYLAERGKRENSCRMEGDVRAENCTFAPAEKGMEAALDYQGKAIAEQAEHIAELSGSIDALFSVLNLLIPGECAAAPRRESGKDPEHRTTIDQQIARIVENTDRIIFRNTESIKEMREKVSSLVREAEKLRR